MKAIVSQAQAAERAMQLAAMVELPRGAAGAATRKQARRTLADRKLDVRVEKARCFDFGLPVEPWPPAELSLWSHMQGDRCYKKLSPMRIHTRDLCMHRDLIRLSLRLVVEFHCNTPRARDDLLERLNAHVRREYSDWPILQARQQERPAAQQVPGAAAPRVRPARPLQ